jgi:hypothetical protein
VDRAGRRGIAELLLALAFAALAAAGAAAIFGDEVRGLLGGAAR